MKAHPPRQPRDSSHPIVFLARAPGAAGIAGAHPRQVSPLLCARRACDLEELVVDGPLGLLTSPRAPNLGVPCAREAESGAGRSRASRAPFFCRPPSLICPPHPRLLYSSLATVVRDGWPHGARVAARRSLCAQPRARARAAFSSSRRSRPPPLAFFLHTKFQKGYHGRGPNAHTRANARRKMDRERARRATGALYARAQSLGATVGSRTLALRPRAPTQRIAGPP